MPSLRDIPAPAKINLFLHVTGRRADGYHLLQTAFRFIDLQDTLHIATRNDGRIVRINDIPGVPEDHDLVVRAARSLQAATGCGMGAEIELIKQIPMGGGLGGGSSDAASTLLALNRLWNCGLTREQLMQLALPLGADVPVFVFGRNAFAEGVGEQLSPLDLPPRWYVIVQPNASVPTPEIFRSPELTRDSPPVRIADFSGSSTSLGKESDKQRSGKQQYSSVFSSYRNDLESVAFARFPEVARIAGVVNEVLADGMNSVGMNSNVLSPGRKVRMSGSGACLFVECDTPEQASWAVEQIAGRMRQRKGVESTAVESSAEVEQSMTDLPYVRINRVCAGLAVHPLLEWVD
jgi:4-diphosphocytidyl-2-C-methyl-D-erythritol kinase